MRHFANRRRHLPTVLGAASTRNEMSLFSSPSAASRMIRARWANPCAVFRRDAKPPSSRRSLSLNSMATAEVDPVLGPGVKVNGRSV